MSVARQRFYWSQISYMHAPLIFLRESYTSVKMTLSKQDRHAVLAMKA